MNHLVAVLISSVFLASPSPRAVSEKERADRLLENGDLAGAGEAYNNALALSPGWAEALNQLGFLLNKQEKREEALEYFKKATKADPRFALAHYNLGATLRKLGRNAEAVEAYKAYIELEPKDASAIFGLAESYRGTGDKAQALAAYERYLASEQDPTGQKRVEKAQAAAAQLRRELGPSAMPAAAGVPSRSSAPAATPAPTAAAARSVPAAPAPAATPVPAAAAARSVPAAPAPAATPVPAAAAARSASAAPAPATAPEAATVPAAASAVAPPPAAAPVASDRAAAATKKFDEAMKLRTQGKPRESMFALQDAVNADPTNVQIVFELGSAYAALGHYPQAVSQWQRVLAMPTTEANHTSAEQNIEKARQKMAGMAPAGPVSAGSDSRGQAVFSDARAAYAKALEAYSAVRYADALREFDRAIAAKPDFAQAYSGRGSTHLAMGDYNRALADYSQAMRLDSSMAYPVFGVAESLTMLGRRSEALRYYQAYQVSRAPDVLPALQERARQRIAEIGK